MSALINWSEATMLVDYSDALSMREARKLYFDANGFGENGGYDEPWVDFKLGPIPMPFKNTKARIEAVRYHDLHHVLTGYDTNTVGEFEIGAWEIAAGCKGFGAAWTLNLGAMGLGFFRAPGRVFAAFSRGRRQRTTYGENLDALLAMSVGEGRARFTPSSTKSGATLADAVLFVLATVVGFAVAILFLALVIPLVPVGLMTHAMRRRRERTTA